MSIFYPVSVLYDSNGNPITVVQDDTGYNLLVTGKVEIVPPAPPQATTPIIIEAANPLNTKQHTTTYNIPSGDTLYIQQIVIGCRELSGGGAMIEVVYDTGSTAHLVERLFADNRSASFSYRNLSSARDNTSLVGDGTSSLKIKRTSLTKKQIPIDVVIRGYLA